MMIVVSSSDLHRAQRMDPQFFLLQERMKPDIARLSLALTTRYHDYANPLEVGIRKIQTFLRDLPGPLLSPIFPLKRGHAPYGSDRLYDAIITEYPLMAFCLIQPALIHQVHTHAEQLHDAQQQLNHYLSFTTPAASS